VAAGTPGATDCASAFGGASGAETQEARNASGERGSAVPHTSKGFDSDARVLHAPRARPLGLNPRGGCTREKQPCLQSSSASTTSLKVFETPAGPAASSASSARTGPAASTTCRTHTGCVSRERVY
jgi:hypothetical protein